MKKNKMNLLIILTLIVLLMSACSAGGAPSNAGTRDSASSAGSYRPPVASSEAPAAAAPGYDGTTAMTDRDPAENRGGSESYLPIDENAARSVQEESLLTFSLKVDTAAYSNVQRYLESGNLPPTDAVRTEELINYFSYDEKLRFTNDHPFAIYTEIGPSPFNEDKYMAFVRVKTEDVDKEDLPPVNLTFLIDTSGSMNSYDKLPLLKEAFALLVETLGEDDRVSIVTYAGSSAVVLDSVSGSNKKAILKAINNLSAGGSTAGGKGIQTAYALAEKNFLEGGNNRVILASDGDFNVGISSLPELEQLIADKRESGVYLSVLGFGTGNTRDDVMETLSKHGNGNYSYINSVQTAKKVLVDELASNLFTIADDVKAQIEFNPQNVNSYRLIGYENRRLANEDFEDDTKDAGEIGIGTDVVMMFELELADGESSLKYQSGAPAKFQGEFADELFEVRIRYKNPGEAVSSLILHPVTFSSKPARNSSDFDFACSVAAFGHLLRDSRYTGTADIDRVAALAKDSLGYDSEGYRLGFLSLLEQYKRIAA